MRENTKHTKPSSNFFFKYLTQMLAISSLPKTTSQETTNLPHRHLRGISSENEYSNNFVSDVWTKPRANDQIWQSQYQYNGVTYNYTETLDAGVNVAIPYQQTSEPYTITYRFPKIVEIKDTFDDETILCEQQLGPRAQKLQRKIFKDLENNILPKNIHFQEVPPEQPAQINFILCNQLPYSALGVANYPHWPDNSTVYIKNTATIKQYESLPFGLESIITPIVPRLFAHETGHAMGLFHTHNEFGFDDDYVGDDITYFSAQSSVMSYYDNECSRTSSLKEFILKSPTQFLAFQGWDKLPEYSSTFGPVDIINLRYGYNPTAPSLRLNQTEDTFPCNAKLPSSVPTNILSPKEQILLGFITGLLFSLIPTAKKKAEAHDYNNLASAIAYMEHILDLVTPSKREDNADWQTSLTNASKDTMIGGARIISPLAAITHDVTSKLLDTNNSKFLCSNLTDIICLVTAYEICRAANTPIYGAYNYERDEPISISIANIAKGVASLVTNLRGINHIIPDSVNNLINKKTTSSWAECINGSIKDKENLDLCETNNNSYKIVAGLSMV